MGIYFLSSANMLKEDIINIIYSDEFINLDYELFACLLVLDLQAISHNLFKNLEENELIYFIESNYHKINESERIFNLTKIIVSSEFNLKKLKWIVNPIYYPVIEFYDDNLINKFNRMGILQQMKDILYTPDFWNKLLKLYSNKENVLLEDKIKNIEKSLSFISESNNINKKKNLRRLRK